MNKLKRQTRKLPHQAPLPQREGEDPKGLTSGSIVLRSFILLPLKFRCLRFGHFSANTSRSPEILLSLSSSCKRGKKLLTQRLSQGPKPPNSPDSRKRTSPGDVLASWSTHLVLPLIMLPEHRTPHPPPPVSWLPGPSCLPS